MGNPRSDLAEWFEQFSGEKLPAGGETDLLEQFGVDGDDGWDFMEGFIARFAIEAENYRWYFHHGEEGWGLGSAFFAPPYRRVERLPITPDLLVEAIETKQWPLRYPPHELPKVRWDIRVNQLLIVVPFVLAGLWLWQRFVR